MKLGTTFLFPRDQHLSTKTQKITSHPQRSERISTPITIHHSPLSNCIQEHWQTTRTDDVGGQVQGFFCLGSRRTLIMKSHLCVFVLLCLNSEDFPSRILNCESSSHEFPFCVYILGG